MMFSMILGTYMSNVVQQGDCNASATFQRLMTSIYWDTIGWYNHTYLDDMFPHLNLIEDHEKHLYVVFTCLFTITCRPIGRSTPMGRISLQTDSRRSRRE
jgi:hypothetical protein